MSVYDDKDRSVHDSAPVECYKFVGELDVYRYTNNNEAVTVNGEVYEPLSSISRSSIETYSLLDSPQTVDINIPITSDLSQAYSFLKMPLTLDLEVRSVHRGTNYATDWKLVWQGQCVAFPVDNNTATVSTQSIIQSSLGQQLNQLTFQTPCNHEVYDVHCGLNPALFTTVTTVTDIKDHVITVANDGNADGALSVGKMVNVRTGEERVIVNNVANVVTVGYPFIDVVLGDTVNLVLGCDNAYSTCQTVFANVLNFGCFMFLPTTNPYVDPV